MTARSRLLCKISEAAFAFRRAVEHAEKKEWGGNFMKFPFQCCGPTSEMLGTYIAHKHDIEVLFVYGFSHAWIECDGIIVDITSDQFHDNYDAIVVTSGIESYYLRFGPEECYTLDKFPWKKSAWRWCRPYKDILSELEPEWPASLFPP